MDPYSAVISAGIGAAAEVAKAPPAGPSEAKSSGTIGGAGFDNSGWNVTFGSGSGITTQRTQTETGEMTKYLPYVVIGVAGLLAWRYLKKSK
jgi:hypothetical protein